MHDGCAIVLDEDSEGLSDILSLNNVCDWRSRVLLPPNVQIQAGRLDEAGSDNTRSCAEYLDRLLDKSNGVNVRRTLGDLVDAANGRYLVCRGVVKSIVNGSLRSLSDSDEETSNKHGKGREQVWTTHITATRQLRAYQQYSGKTVNCRYDIAWLDLYFCRGWKPNFRAGETQSLRNPSGSFLFKVSVRERKFMFGSALESRLIC